MVNALRYNAYLVLAIGLALSMPVLADTSTRVHKFDGTVSQLPECLENEPKTDFYAEVTTPDYRYRGDCEEQDLDRRQEPFPRESAGEGWQDSFVQDSEGGWSRSRQAVHSRCFPR